MSFSIAKLNNSTFYKFLNFNIKTHFNALILKLRFLVQKFQKISFAFEKYSKYYLYTSYSCKIMKYYVLLVYNEVFMSYS